MKNYLNYSHHWGCSSRENTNEIRKEYNDGFPDPIELYGIGKYLKTLGRAFKNNNMNVKPKDKVLQEYLK